MRFLVAKLAKLLILRWSCAPDHLGKVADALRFIFAIVELN